MAKPASRAEFKEYCLRRLGKPVIEINVDDDQVEDRIDEALEVYQDYHYDATVKTYKKFVIDYSVLKFTSNVSSNTCVTGTITGASSGATANVAGDNVGNVGSYLRASLNYYAANGDTFSVFTSGETVTNSLGLPIGTLVTSTTESDYLDYGSLDTHFITMPDDVIGITNIFDLNDRNTVSMFDVRYQMHLNDVTTFRLGGGYEMLTYEMRMNNYQMINELLAGKPLVRYNRHENRLHLDLDWDHRTQGEYIVVDSVQTLDPNAFTKVYNDIWLKQYCTALIKRQWGMNLSKYDGVPMPGGVTLNGRQILDDAKEEIERLREELQLKFELPVDMMMG